MSSRRPTRRTGKRRRPRGPRCPKPAAARERRSGSSKSGPSAGSGSAHRPLGHRAQSPGSGHAAGLSHGVPLSHGYTGAGSNYAAFVADEKRSSVDNALQEGSAGTSDTSGAGHSVTVAVASLYVHNPALVGRAGRVFAEEPQRVFDARPLAFPAPPSDRLALGHRAISRRRQAALRLEGGFASCSAAR